MSNSDAFLIAFIASNPRIKASCRPWYGVVRGGWGQKSPVLHCFGYSLTEHFALPYTAVIAKALNSWVKFRIRIYRGNAGHIERYNRCLRRSKGLAAESGRQWDRRCWANGHLRGWLVTHRRRRCVYDEYRPRVCRCAIWRVDHQKEEARLRQRSEPARGA